MSRDDIIRMAREAGIDAESDTLCRYEGWVEPLARFADFVAKRAVSNIDPASSMSYQEGYAAGVAAEREACAQFAEDQIGRATAAKAALQMTKATHALKIAKVEARRDALLEALKELLEVWEEDPAYGHASAEKARATIKAEEA